jgi:hypothetical protein
MFDNDSQQLNDGKGFIDKEKINWKKYLLIIIPIVVICIVIILFLIFKSDNEEIKVIDEPKDEEKPIITGLPQYLGLRNLSDEADLKIDPALDEAVEYLNFVDFYQAPTKVLDLNYLSYDLPLDVKTKVVNYYDLNRKINLDPYLHNLSINGFSKINNPWPNQANDFYRAYNSLIERQIPLFISSDFLLYHYNLILKKVWQEIENSFFFDSLWELNLHLFNSSKLSYENYLTKVGQVNDPILEAKRLRLVYFAVALELLKPETRQISTDSKIDETKFSVVEAKYLDYNLPAYLEKDIMSEIELIKKAQELTKSPVFLYERDYRKFRVPKAYQQSARKNNYYLASVWLSSLFPLNYQSEKCPDCLLDINDWRINFTAASLISQDIASSQYLRAEWARIYKIMSFFSGLEDTLTYIYYKNDYQQLFADEKLVDIFSLENENSLENLENYREKLLAHDFKEIQGGLDHHLEENQAQIGFRLLARPHWPIDYLDEKLVYPHVSQYLGDDLKNYNTTACRLNNIWQRCLSFFADSLNLLKLEVTNDYLLENTNYQNYNQVLNEIDLSVINALNARANAFWSQLASLNFYLDVDKSSWPVFAQNNAWQERLFFTAGSALIDWQMPADSFRRLRFEEEIKTGLIVNDRERPSVYLEPALNLVNDLLANIQMLSKIFSALGADSKSSLAMINLDALYSDLLKLSELYENNLALQNLNQEDQALIINWLSSYEITDKADKRIKKDSNILRTSLSQDLNQLDFLIIVFPTENGPTMALSPIFNLKER